MLTVCSTWGHTVSQSCTPNFISELLLEKCCRQKFIIRVVSTIQTPVTKISPENIGLSEKQGTLLVLGTEVQQQQQRNGQEACRDSICQTTRQQYPRVTQKYQQRCILNLNVRGKDCTQRQSCSRVEQLCATFSCPRCHKLRLPVHRL